MIGNAEFGFICGSFGGVQTSDDGFLIPIAKTAPFTPAMLTGQGPPPGGAQYRIKVYRNETVVFMVEAKVGWTKHLKSGEVWLVIAKPANWQEVAEALQQFQGQKIALAFERL